MRGRGRLLGVEEVDQVAVDAEPGFGERRRGGGQREQDEEDEAAEGEAVAQEAAPEHPPDAEPLAAGEGGLRRELVVRCGHWQGIIGKGSLVGDPGVEPAIGEVGQQVRSEEHTSELQSLMRNSYAVLCLKKKNNKTHIS